MYKNLAAIVVAFSSTVRETPCLAGALPTVAVAP
jgi:hypothetical protein